MTIETEELLSLSKNKNVYKIWSSWRCGIEMLSHDHKLPELLTSTFIISF